MKKTLLLLVLSFVFSFSMYAQDRNAWKKTDSKNLQLLETVKRETFPSSYELLDLNLEAFKSQLLQAPKRELNTLSNIIVSIPVTGNEFERYRIYEASNFDAELQNKYPNIRAYVGVGVENPANIVRISLDPRGVQMMLVLADKPSVFIEPYATNARTYAVYNSNRNKGKLPFTCSTQDHAIANGFNNQTTNNRSSTGQLLNFRLALSCTAEYANFFGASNSSQYGLVLAAYNATMSRVNGIFEKDFAIKMTIVAESSNVAFYNPATDPYSPASIGASGAWNTELQNTLSSTLTGPSTSLAANNAAYDVGHLFGASGGGGNAGCIGCVCENDTASLGDTRKGSGYTSPAGGGPVGDTFDIDFVAHEFGHQFGANHTFSQNNEGAGVNVEPGSGSTIMGYAGLTSYDVQQNSDAYFHAVSIEQVQTNMQSKTCPTATPITHSAPVVNAGGNWIIPKGTPFMLTGSATDAGGAGALTYCWEQVDTGNSGTTGANSSASPTKTSGPNFRSYNPTTSPTRYFPRLESLLANSLITSSPEITVEAINTNGRVLNFRLTARDNIAGQGQTNFGNASVTTSNFSGPFNVTSQNTTGIVWLPGSTQNITWTVANTASLVGSANVDILLSTDGGFTYPIVLLSNTPNDGNQTITVPNVSSLNCRVMVKPTGNIFFDINEQNFTVGTFVLQNVCTDYEFPINQAITEIGGGLVPSVPLQVNDSFVLTDANVRIEATHPNVSELAIGIQAPHQASLQVALWFNNPCAAQSPANMNLVFDAQGTAVNCANTTSGAATLPTFAGPFAALVGNNSNGAWRVHIADNVINSNNAGTLLNKVTLNLCGNQLVPLATENFAAIDDLVLYPNPNNGSFNIQFKGSSNEITIDVHDIRGRKVFDKTFANSGLFNETLNLENTQSGIYIVSIVDGDRKEVKKIIVN